MRGSQEKSCKETKLHKGKMARSIATVQGRGRAIRRPRKKDVRKPSHVWWWYIRYSSLIVLQTL